MFSRFIGILMLWILFGGSLEALTSTDIPINPHKNNNKKTRKCAVSVCAIFKNEGPYLREWIEYYRLLGVKHFYLYNNLSTDNTQQVLEPYVNEGIVELFEVPFDSTLSQDFAKTHNFVQVCCYNHAIRLSKEKSKWLAIIDADEFICPVSDDNLVSLLKRYDDAPGLIVFWQIYGTSNVWDLGPSDLMIEKLLNKFPVNSGSNLLFKSIVKPKHAICLNPHSCKYTHGHAVTENHTRFHHGTLISPLIDIVRINHYTYRTESYYYYVKKPRRIEWGFNPSPEMERAFLDEGNSVYDPVMMKFVPELRKRMFHD